MASLETFGITPDHPLAEIVTHILAVTNNEPGETLLVAMMGHIEQYVLETERAEQVRNSGDIML